MKALYQKRPHPDAHIWTLNMDLADNWRKWIAQGYFVSNHTRSIIRDRANAVTEMKFLLFGPASANPLDTGVGAAADRTFSILPVFPAKTPCLL